MLKNRHEEYEGLSVGLPFALNCDIERSSTLYIAEANWHDNIEIQLCKSGEGRVLLDGDTLLLRAGELVAINSNVIHHTGADGRIVYSCLIIDKKFCADADIDTSSLLFRSDIGNDNEMRNIFLEIERVYADTADPCRTARLRMLTLSMLVTLRERYTQGRLPVSKDDVAFTNVKNAVNFISTHYTERITLDCLAKSVYTDNYILSRQFKRIMGQTVIEYVNGYRMRLAAALLREGRTAAEAARLCGFNNLSFFSKTFKKYMGSLPSEYKNK